MALSLYKKKRTFKSTPEPEGGKVSGKELRFVVQKHAASRLHYDFRLEMDGVLKSWAVPKGSSLNPTDKRLAMMVEDHPYDYRNFEGIIPKGNYGAGTVMVWDEGTYEPLEKKATLKEQQKEVIKELKSGSIKILMHGKKLKGEFALVKIKSKEDNAWLLIKHRDKYAKETDVTAKDKSVISGKTLQKIATSSNNIYGIAKEEKSANKKTSVKPAPAKKIARKTAAKKTPTKKKGTPSNIEALVAKGKKAAMPKNISPMLATLVDKPFDEVGWQYEVKWDGYRAMAFINNGKVDLLSRNNKSFNEKFYPVHDALNGWEHNAVLDGEIAVLNDKGLSAFGALQNWRSEADGELVYYVFDILWLNGVDLKGLSLEDRRQILKTYLPAGEAIRFSENFDTSATEFLATAAKMNMEGIIAKKADSVYEPGARSRTWLKIKVHKRHEVVIGGFTQNEGSAKTFSSLLVGLYANKKLQYIGKIGTGFSDKQQKEMMKEMKPLITKKVPFTETPDVDKPSRFRPNPPKASVTWLQPKLVCEVSYAEITSDGVMRHPSFEGMREDKNAADVTREIEVPVQDAKQAIKKTAAGKTKNMKTDVAKTPTYLKPVTGKERKTLLNPTEETQVKKINGHELKFTNLGKIYWPKEKYSKRDMLNYYYQAAPYLLPYLKNRPQSMNRFPNGIDGKSFYQKDVTGKVPDWIELSPYTTDGEAKNFLVPQDESSILYMANLGTIEMNPWNSTVQKPNNPDWCLIDLDPSDKTSFEQVIQTAQVTKDVLDDLGILSYPKTSGSTGIHVYIPLGAKYSYDECQLFAKMVATRIMEILPDFTTTERMIRNRKGKMYIDYLQNRPKATLAAPYSLRPKPGACVSMPLHWEEVKKGLKMQDFTIKNAMARIKEVGDIFKPVLGKGVDLKKMLRKISAENK